MQLIFGIGKTGLSVARFFANNNIDFIIADDDKNPSFLTQCLQYKPVANYCGMVNDIALENISQAVISPGIAKNSLIIKKLQQANITIISDIEIFAAHTKAAIVAITGSNGKSTVVSLLNAMAKKQNIKVAMAGNIGIAVLDVLDSNIDLYILELSSYQLDYLNNIKLKIALVLNITPEHLDRYKNFNDYINSKLSIYKYADIAIIPTDEPLVNINKPSTNYSLNIPKTPTEFGTISCHNQYFIIQNDKHLIAQNDIKIIGKHNISNILAALTVGYKLGFNINNMIDTIRHFRAINHRLELVLNDADIYYYNDSKATNSASTAVAIEAIIKLHNNTKIAIIIGGRIKQESYQELADMVNKFCYKIIIIGEARQQINHLFDSKKTVLADSMAQAVKFAKNSIDKGVILLSPACASFDMFNDFNHRGDEFKKAVI